MMIKTIILLFTLFTSNIAFAAQDSYGLSLSLLLLDTVKEDPFIEKAISLHGFERVQSSVVVHIKDTTNLYRSRWDKLILTGSEKVTHQCLLESHLFKEAYQDLINNLKIDCNIKNL